jgi:mannose-6-phosphate isomerase-like protein (cupin superfamily)
MPKVSKESATNVKDFGVAEDRSDDVDGYTINFVTIRESHDLAPMLKGLPSGNCSCPHWGYVLKGRIIVRYDDHEEVLEAGDAFYMPPGHAPEAEAGTELIQISPAEDLAVVEAALMKTMQESHGG